MDFISIYAITAGGILGTLFLIRVASSLMTLSNTISVMILKHLSYPYILNRHRLIGPWTRANVLSCFAYIAVNVFFVAYRAQSAVRAGRRAGTLTLVNMAFLVLATHLSFLADILGISLRTCRRIHRAMGYTTTGLLAFHVVITLLVQQDKFPLDNQGNLFALIVCDNFNIGGPELTTCRLRRH